MPDYQKLQIISSEPAEKQAGKRRIARNLLRLREALRDHLAIADLRKDIDELLMTRDNAQFLRLATWNIREFDSQTYGRRLDESIYYIAEILSHFDLIAIQEVREDRHALERVMQILGPHWLYIATDVTEGNPGNRERMVFVYNSHKVKFRNVAGEVILPEDKIDQLLRFKKKVLVDLPHSGPLLLPEDVDTYTRSGKEKLKEEVSLPVPENTRLILPEGASFIFPKGTEIKRTGTNQVFVPGENGYQDILLTLPHKVFEPEDLNFARTPFLVSFQAGWLTLNLCTVHIYYGTGQLGMRRRKDEISRLVDFLAERAQSDFDSDAKSFFVALGDFNIVDHEHETMKSLKRHGFAVPDQLQSLPGTNVEKDKYYDQIAFWHNPQETEPPLVNIDILRAGVFDFYETVFRYFETAEDGRPQPEQVDLETYLATDPAFKQVVEETLAKKAKSKGRPLTAVEERDEKRKKFREWRTHQMSDHLPMWVELRSDFGDDFLESLVNS